MPLTKHDFKLWKGVNVQEFSTTPPKPDETRLALYLIDVNKGLSKEFRHVNNAVQELVQRKISHISYGSKGGDVAFKVVVKWEQPYEEAEIDEELEMWLEANRREAKKP